jgi:hypothetical protein
MEAVGFKPLPLYCGVTAPGTHCTGSWVVPRASVHVVEIKKNLLVITGIELGFLGCPVGSL